MIYDKRITLNRPKNKTILEVQPVLFNKQKNGSEDVPKKQKKRSSSFKASTIFQTREILQDTNLHGVAHITDQQVSTRYRLVWFLIVFTFVIICLVTIANLIDRFMVNPTITALDTDSPLPEIKFPAIFICAQNLADGNKVEAFINRLYQPNSLDNDTYIRYQNFLSKLPELNFDNIREIVYEYRDVIEGLKVDDLRSVIKEITASVKDLDLENNPALVRAITERGLCFGHGSEVFEQDCIEDKIEISIRKDKSLSRKFYIPKEMRAKFYIVPPDDFFGLDYYTVADWEVMYGHELEISLDVKVIYGSKDFKKLSLSQRKCILPEDNAEIQEWEKEYTYGGCMRRCRMQRSLKFCECVPHLYPEQAGQQKCTTAQLVCLAEKSDDIKYPMDCPCLIPCDQKVYEVAKYKYEEIDYEQEDKDCIEISMTKQLGLQYVREVTFGWVDLLVSTGGIAGFFIGFSLISLVEVLYYYTIRLGCMPYHNKEELDKFKKELEESKTVDYDLRLHNYK